jgi:hypothetical protein
MPINIVYYTTLFMTTQPLTPNEKTLGKAVGQAASNVFNRTLGRLFGAGLNKGAVQGKFGGTPETARWTVRNGSTDWRVKLTIPSQSPVLADFFGDGSNIGANGVSYKVMQPLAKTNGVIFPITPSVIIQHTANYSQMATAHANYPYYAYQNSEPANMTIVGEFPVQNQEDAAHWVATVHFLRAVTKMFFGGDKARGNPPPILKLNGYGNHVFKNIPVIVTNFTCELRADVDYICTSQGPGQPSPSMAGGIDAAVNKGLIGANSNIPETWAPSLSTITVQLQPVYSRDTVKNFSMKKFASGELHNFGQTGKNVDDGIGFI